MTAPFTGNAIRWALGWESVLHRSWTSRSPFGILLSPLERNNHTPHAQHLDGVLRAVFQQHGAGDHSFHDPGEAGYPAIDPEANSPDAANERTATPNAGNSGTLQRRPGQGFTGNDAAVPGVRCQPHRLPGPPGSAVADTHRAVPGLDSDPVHETGRPGGVITETLPVDYLRPHSFRRSPERHLPLAEAGRTGPFSRSAAHIGGRVHLGAAENDHDPLAGPPPAVQSDHDALDDSHIPGILLTPVAQRSPALLDCFQYNWRRHPVLHNRLGAVVPTDSQVGSGAKQADPVRRLKLGDRGDRRRWTP